MRMAIHSTLCLERYCPRVHMCPLFLMRASTSYHGVDLSLCITWRKDVVLECANEVSGGIIFTDKKVINGARAICISASHTLSILPDNLDVGPAHTELRGDN